MKYIIFKDTVSGLIQPVLFGEHTTHSSVKLDRAKPVSAGFFDFSKGIPTIYGKSVSLNLEPGVDDLDYITKMFLNLGTMYFISLDNKKKKGVEYDIRTGN
jgi:hypothetical protein